MSRASAVASPSPRLLLLAFVASASALGFAAAPAFAAQDEARPRTAPSAAKAVAKPSPGPILAVVSLAKQRIWVHGRDGLIAQSAVSTGMTGYPTPTGVFSVVQKSRFHRSNIYSDAPMPYMQRLTWSGIALHAGVVPGRPASHGCIRLPSQFAVEMWGLTRIGARVVVAPDDATVSDIAHPRLPVPAATSAAHATIADRGPALVGVAHAETAEAAGPPLKNENPLVRAKAARQAAIADAAVKAKAAQAAVALSAAKAAEASRTIGTLRTTELALATALAKRDAAAKAVQEAPDAAERARKLLADAETRLADAEKAVQIARAAEAEGTPAAIAAAKAAWEAEQADAQAAATLKATERNTEPISIFVSKKAGRVYIRQGWLPVHEAPATFSGPDQPIGTHAFLAKDAPDDGRTLRWIAVSLPPSRPPEPRPGPRRDAPQAQPSPPPKMPAPPAAASALERFDLTEETRAFIADRLWAGAFLVVSDEAMSTETGVTTDFIVLTRH